MTSKNKLVFSIGRTSIAFSEQSYFRLSASRYNTHFKKNNIYWVSKSSIERQNNTSNDIKISASLSKCFTRFIHRALWLSYNHNYWWFIAQGKYKLMGFWPLILLKRMTIAFALSLCDAEETLIPTTKLLMTSQTR